jgi:hypothetical protein
MAAPFDWYSSNGLTAKLSFAGKAGEFLGYLAAGPALAMLAVVLASRFIAVPDPAAKQAHLLLDLVLIAAAVAAWLPTPTWPPYLVVMLPPLAVKFGLCVQVFLSPAKSAFARRSLLAGLAVTAPFGWLEGVAIAKSAVAGGNPVLSETKEAQWLGEQLAGWGAEGPVASFTARWVIDSGYRLDPRFAPGVFVFRSGLLLSGAEARRLNVIVPQTLASEFDAAPPAAIVTGGQMGTNLFSLRPDQALLDYANSRNWTRLEHPTGKMTVFINPQFARGPCKRLIMISGTAPRVAKASSNFAR